jgi:hypothetical protein
MSEIIIETPTASDKPQITHSGFLSLQVCVPRDWTNEQVERWTNQENLCGTTNGWRIRREGDKALGGDHERVDCEGREGFVHIMLDA